MFKINANFFDITKSAIAIVLTLFVIFKVFPYFEKRDSQPRLDETVITRIAENVMKASLAENDKKLETLIAALKAKDSETLKTIKANSENIKEVGLIVAEIKGKSSSAKSDVISDGGDHSRDIDTTVVYQTVADNKKLPVATVYYSPNVKDNVEKWGIQTHPIDYYASVVSTEDKDGHDNRYVELWAENNFTPQSKGKKFPITLKNVDWVKKEISDKSFMFNPRLAITAALGLDAIYPNLDLSLFSYGRTKRDMDWRFLSIGVGGDRDNMYLGITPLSYNVGQFLPLIENMFVGPYVGTSFKALGTNLNYGMTLSIPF